MLNFKTFGELTLSLFKECFIMLNIKEARKYKFIEWFTYIGYYVSHMWFKNVFIKYIHIYTTPIIFA